MEVSSMSDWGRRQFIGLLGGAAAWPATARAQQPGMPTIGYLYAGSAQPVIYLVEVFRQGLAETGYVEGHNVRIDYRWAEGDYTRLPAMAVDLVRRDVAVIATPPSTAAALAAKAATSTTPIVFVATEDPVKLGLVASLARPGGNATGLNFFAAEIGAKQFGLLHELLPSATRVGLLVNPNNANTRSVVTDVTAAASTIGVRTVLVEAGNGREIDMAFTALAHHKVDALVVGPDSVFANRRVHLTTLAARHGIPTILPLREFPEVGGLMSYGTSLREVYRQLGVYAGRILKGAKPADLPVLQSTRFELVINLNTARALGLEIPPTLLARADEVIE
jgi:putative tryptophan/tyrosine transport system substrate-binding protein